MVRMDRLEFYKHYIPAVKKAILLLPEVGYCGYFPGPEVYLDTTECSTYMMDQYIDENSGKDDVLDMIGYFFDAFSHGFDAIEGIDIKNYKEQILKTLDDYPNWI